MPDYTPITELEAVNEMLSAIGQSEVNTLAVTGIRDVNLARQRLHFVSRKVQGMGWDFNTLKDVTLTPDGNQEVAVPANTLNVDACDDTADVTERDGKLFNKETNTFKFDEPIDVEIVEFLAFESLPNVVRTFIAMRASHDFQKKFLGADSHYSYTLEDVIEAWGELVRFDAQNQDLNVRRNPHRRVNQYRRMY